LGRGRDRVLFPDHPIILLADDKKIATCKTGQVEYLPNNVS